MLDNACIMVEEKDLSKGILENKISDLIINKEKIKNLENDAKKISYDRANSDIIKHINDLINA